jgi:hypothetical protein
LEDKDDQNLLIESAHELEISEKILAVPVPVPPLPVAVSLENETNTE